MTINLPELWQAAAVLLGLQATGFAWRVQQEAAVADKNDITWLPPADYLNLFAMLLSAVGIFAGPAMGLIGLDFARMSFGLVVALLVGHAFVLAGHYELFTRGRRRSFRYFPPQEKVALFFVVLVVVGYLLLWAKPAFLVRLLG